MYTIYQIMAGDTLSNLALKFKTNMENLRRINNLPFNYDFTVGEQIIVPANSDDSFFYYTVQNGDNIYSLARRYNINMDTLLQINGLKKDEYIYPGEQLMIPQINVTTYVVENNEILNDVSKKLNTSVENLLRENQNIYLLPGQLITLSK